MTGLFEGDLEEALMPPFDVPVREEGVADGLHRIITEFSCGSSLTMRLHCSCTTHTRDVVLSQESIMGNLLSKCDQEAISFHEHLQWCSALPLPTAFKKRRYRLDQLRFSRDPGPVPVCFAAALDICVPFSAQFTPTQIRGLKKTFLAYAHKHSDKAIWKTILQLAMRMPGGNSDELIHDRFCGLVLWITFEEKRNSKLIELIHFAAANYFFHEVHPKCVSTVAQALLDVSPSKTCAYQSCKSGCMLRNTYTCSGCGVVTYCGTYCQQAAWESHKDICRLFQTYGRNACPEMSS